MKAKTILTALIATLIFSSCCTETKKNDFLFLNPTQLKNLGIDVTEQGVFYKNFNPNWQEDKNMYPILCFYLGNADNFKSRYYQVVIQMDKTDTISVESESDSLLAIKEATKNDFYPILIGDTKGNQSMNQELPTETKLLPVAVCMAETKLAKRQDTIIVWFKPTESLQKELPENIKMEDYLQTKPIVEE